VRSGKVNWIETLTEDEGMRKVIVLSFLTTGMLAAQEAKVTPLLSKDLPDISGKEGTMLMVDYPPGGSGSAHRHNADVFVYVLEGTMEMQVQGGAPVTIGPGQTFYEGPTDIHLVSRNASKTRPARFVVFFVKNKGAPVTTPVK
jgi:quercetin dioxygenase-like cupin family protein